MISRRHMLAAAAAAVLAGPLLPAGPALGADLSGQWKGRWRSCTTGHEGPLKAEICRVDACHYDVTFSGRFFKLLPFRYNVRLQVVQEGEVVTLRGSEHLGRLFGTFHYHATASRCVFKADYCSADDRGWFHLQRR